VIVVAPPPAPPTEDQQMIGLLADLQRFGNMQAEELKRELASALASFSRQRTDINRVRLAVLYTLVRQSPQDDQRALQLFENVAKNSAPNSPIGHLAAVLQTQVVERQRAVHDEQQKADAAIQKLEALRAMERSLLRDRVRSGGGGGASGAGGSGR
jgi:isochorismate hydrolase